MVMTSFGLYAQHTVTVVVTDSSNDPVPGVSIQVQGTTSGTDQSTYSTSISYTGQEGILPYFLKRKLTLIRMIGYVSLVVVMFIF
ncbi:hypothetical protein CDL62_13660 [Alkalitalea saponilacus]|nr:hypothetical protein CDL62_13660 [Alkalitalea saponilacus]